MNFDQEAALWIDQTRALDASLGLSDMDRRRVLNHLAESSPAELLAAIEKVQA
ncbi:hypothetical protein [Rhodococcus sp. SORGH_AS_0303]|uniref:hypothetical protein n=1 Tax=Rhodococcus sp. SORGH_AS_0303 TaxID=3041753 RepID=UPI00278614A2|nr:hypothetical protein [Rhodococcus sp. SORGH_AS_0303]MDQ1202826.1 hypothetical protein [Rhodococcus sp. SORGH_AS_0303]